MRASTSLHVPYLDNYGFSSKESYIFGKIVIPTILVVKIDTSEKQCGTK